MALTDVNTMYVAGSNERRRADGVQEHQRRPNLGVASSTPIRTQNVATGWSGSGGDRGWGYGQIALGFDVDPADADQLIITDEGFAHSSTDGGTTWQALYVNPADRNTAGRRRRPASTYHDSGLDNTTSWGCGVGRTRTMSSSATPT